ncbi:hypothetical protein [Virgibacillus sp. DJP39]|uniref:hypothetical protein n=1 Tax=Virgibacillus sp. DJP39 TaxID=3409790 RepID=UPI003BB71CDF
MNNSNHKLDLILDTLVELKKDFSSHKEDFSSIKKDFISHKENLSSLKEDFTSHKVQTSNKLDRIESTLSRIENEHPKDIMVMLKQIDSKLDLPDSKLNALNNRVFKVEADIELLKK